jgi:hypothetical protein
VLTDCKEVFEGLCWAGNGPENSETVYFQAKGKKLSPMIVAKMALTAKKITTRQYDFQMPSADEEARAEKLSESADQESAAETDKAEAPADLHAAYQARAAELTNDLKKALTSGTPAGKEAGLRFSEALTYARKKDFAQALALLDVVAQQIKQALAGQGAAKGIDPAAFAERWAAARAAWQNASDTVDNQIAQLQQALRAAPDDDLHEIAEFGLNAVTGNFKVPLQVAVREIDSAKGDALQGFITRARTIVADFQNHIQGSEQVLVCDENPFGVKVTIRASLGQALTQMQDALKAGA